MFIVNNRDPWRLYKSQKVSEEPGILSVTATGSAETEQDSA